MEINGIRHWRAYTITSDPDHPEGVVSITVKHTEGGKMSPVFMRQVQAGQQVYLGEVEGEFTLPDPLPERMLFISGRQRHHADHEHAARARPARRARRRRPHPQLPHAPTT